MREEDPHALPALRVLQTWTAVHTAALSAQEDDFICVAI